MYTLRDYIIEEKEQEFEKQLNEDALTVIGSVLGYTTTGLIYAFGAVLLAYGGIRAIKALTNLIQKTIKTAKGVKKTPKEVAREIQVDPKVTVEKNNIERKARQYEDELKGLYAAISSKDFETASEEFKKLDPSLQNLPDVHKAIITDITKTMKEPPLYVRSPGNKTYQAIKKVLNLKVAKAAAKATELALIEKLNMEE